MQTPERTGRNLEDGAVFEDGRQAATMDVALRTLAARPLGSRTI
jgi:hypothetical protein